MTHEEKQELRKEFDEAFVWLNKHEQARHVDKIFDFMVQKIDDQNTLYWKKLAIDRGVELQKLKS